MSQDRYDIKMLRHLLSHIVPMSSHVQISRYFCLMPTTQELNSEAQDFNVGQCMTPLAANQTAVQEHEVLNFGMWEKYGDISIIQGKTT